MKTIWNISTTTIQILFKLLYVITFNGANCKTYNKSEKLNTSKVKSTLQLNIIKIMHTCQNCAIKRLQAAIVH